MATEESQQEHASAAGAGKYIGVMRAAERPDRTDRLAAVAAYVWALGHQRGG